MYHKINIPDCAPLLMRLTEIAGQVVAFGLTNDLSMLDGYRWDGTEQKGLAKSLGADFLAAHEGHCFLAAVKEHFLAHFAAWGRPEVGTWLWDKYAKIAAPIVKLVALPYEQKADVLAAFQNDIDLDGILRRSERKVFCSQELSGKFEAAQTIIKGVLISFYEDILVAQGVPARVIGEENALSHQEILQSYRRMNMQLMVCPGCDGDPPLRVFTRPRLRRDGKPHHTIWLSANIDHFLPKAKYFFLSVHPLNLVPLCTVCNQDRKADKDPLDPAEVLDLEDIYHPYLRGAIEEVTAVVERDESDGLPHMHLRLATDDPHARARLSSLEHVLGLQNDWDGKLQSGFLDGQVVQILSHVTQDERSANERHLDNWLCKKLRTIGKQLNYNIGSAPHTVATQAYSTWLATDGQAQDERVRLVNKALGIEPGAINPVQQQIHPRPII